MRAPTHIAFGLFTGSVSASFLNSSGQFHLGINWFTGWATLITVLGALVPDLDTPNSSISKIAPPISRLIRMGFGHRTLTHSFIGLGLGGLLFYGFLSGIDEFLEWYLNRPGSIDYRVSFSMLFGSSYLSHLILDTCTRRGCPLLYPLLKNPFGYPSVEQYRFITGDNRAEYSISSISLLLMVLYLPITDQGAEASLHNAIGRFTQLRSSYLDVSNKEVVLEFEGIEESSKTSVAGRGLILSVSASYIVSFVDQEVVFIGEDQGDIHLKEGRCVFLDIPPSNRKSSYRESSFPDILSDISSEVLLSGHLYSSSPFDVRKPYNVRTINITSNKIEMSFASLDDLVALEVQPAKKSMSEKEIKLRLSAMQGTIDSLIDVRKNLKEIYDRTQILDEMAVIKKEVEKLERKLKFDTVSDQDLTFSGDLMFRVIPTY